MDKEHVCQYCHQFSGSIFEVGLRPEKTKNVKKEKRKRLRPRRKAPCAN